MTILLRYARVAACVLGILFTGTAPAAAYPDKPIRMLVPYPPGGITDVLSRSVAELLRKELGQPVIVENKPGANTALAAQALATSPADGYTVMMAAAATVVMNPLLYPKLGYEPVRDFTPAARIAETPLVLVVRSDSTARTLADLIATAKAKPGDTSFASTGLGSTLHLAGELLQLETGTQLLHVPYKGSAPALNGVLGGETHFMIDSVGSSIPLIKGGKLRAIAVTSAKRLPALPEVPTVAESGVPGFDVSTWFGLLVPKQTPAAIVTRLNAAVALAVRDPSFRAQFEAVGLVVPAPIDSAAFAKFIQAETAKWAPLIKAKNISLE
ncbi:Bug family tripartite tricarboxylate transporter substrate binding protein [Aquabacterium sp.]|uniref:Bug family tripartite tricarboxylate transporter substrate binding protein n=1 Tax=Aquabacterium sp. TaxID=1872578 RepID=UPI002B6D305A|nr:tripartite tricarboxylate transporter substrate binding protein [Aquabacterium sp.]HSW03562.1 tripartite tricarboxylate transporter substrate binding protein [Aquabacterium sp.]